MFWDFLFIITFYFTPISLIFYDFMTDYKYTNNCFSIIGYFYLFIFTPFSLILYDYITDYKNTNIYWTCYYLFLIFGLLNIWYNITETQKCLKNNGGYYRSYKQSPLPPNINLSSTF